MKSDARQLLNLGMRIIRDAAAKCYTVTVADWPLDVKRLASRIENEGLSFLTITLPAFGSSFEKCLAREAVDSTDWPGWAKRGCLPTFLRGFTSLVFEQSGCLKEDPDVAAIEGIRQICYSFKKILLPCTPEREARAIESYLAIEQALNAPSLLDGLDSDFDSVTRLLWGDVFGGEVDHRVLIPKHGPGATCEGIRGNRKYAQRTWHDRLQPYFPYDETAYNNVLAGTSMLKEAKFIREDEELPVKVSLVPKTLKTPRIIAIEPVCMQYTQQAISGYLIKCLGNHWITGGHINFTDQTVNQRLAVVGSVTGKLSTLDLSSASDRVPLSGVERMLAVNQDLLDMLLATRSTRAKMPNGDTITLRKFASMGSATCFPVEAMYFYSLIAWGLWKRSGQPLTLRNLKNLLRDVYIYGDDIIVPTDAVESALSALARGNCEVGLNKSFWTGKFRESCGIEAYNGEDVTPTYIRRMGPESKRDASAVISWVSTSNQFYKRGYWETAAYMVKHVESIVGSLPLVTENSAGLGWVNYQGGYSVHRWNNKLHRFEVNTYVPSIKHAKDSLDGYPALMKCLLSLTRREDSGVIDKVVPDDYLEIGNNRARAVLAQDTQHLHRSVRFGTVSMKRRRTTPY